MPNYAEYFEKNRPKPVWHIGDRVFGKYKKIPFVGTVGNDNMVSEQEGPRVTVHLDLPIKVDNEYKLFLIVKQKDIKRLTVIEEEISKPTKTKK